MKQDVPSLVGNRGSPTAGHSWRRIVRIQRRPSEIAVDHDLGGVAWYEMSNAKNFVIQNRILVEHYPEMVLDEPLHIHGHVLR